MFWSIDSFYPLNIIFATDHNFEHLLNVIFYYFYNCQSQLMRSQIGRHVCYSNQSQARLDGRNRRLAKTRHCFFGISNICSDRIWGHQASSLSWSVQEATLSAKTEALPHLAGIGSSVVRGEYVYRNHCAPRSTQPNERITVLEG